MGGGGGLGRVQAGDVFAPGVELVLRETVFPRDFVLELLLGPLHADHYGQAAVLLVFEAQFERPKLRVRVTKYPKFVCSEQPECGVVEPARPASLVEGNRYDTSIAAEIVTAKYAYHLPTYREEKRGQASISSVTNEVRLQYQGVTNENVSFVQS